MSAFIKEQQTRLIGEPYSFGRNRTIEYYGNVFLILTFVGELIKPVIEVVNINFIQSALVYAGP